MSDCTCRTSAVNDQPIDPLEIEVAKIEHVFGQHKADCAEHAELRERMRREVKSRP